MGIIPMGGALVLARIEILKDVYDTDKGRLRNDQIRSLEPDDALVDTGATIIRHKSISHKTSAIAAWRS